MLNARSVVLTTIVVAAISMLISGLSLLNAPGEEGLGRDFYGTRPEGFRAVYETLSELAIPVERSEKPPSEIVAESAVLVLWSPHSELVAAEPAYLHRVAEWVRGGGRVIVAPRTDYDRLSKLRRAMSENYESVLEALGLEKLDLEAVDPNVEIDAEAEAEQLPEAEQDEESSQEEPSTWFDAFRTEPDLVEMVDVEADGELEFLDSAVNQLQVPLVDLRVIDSRQLKPAGRLMLSNAAVNSHLLAALYRLGRGEVIVVGDPRLLQNRLIASADNAVLATYLLAAGGRTIVFDGFYHGLTVRGNPLWLLTYSQFRWLALAIAVLTAVWLWRRSVFLGPPLRPVVENRRTIREYVEAMARFFLRGRESRPFLLSEVRDGVLWMLRHHLRLRPGHETLENIAAVMARKDPAAAQRLVAAVQSVNSTIAEGDDIPDRDTIQAFQRISSCL